MPRILIREPGKDPQPYRFGLDAGTVTLGRAAGNDIVLTCGSISGRHASMERVTGGFRLIDHDSTNGVFRGGEPLKQADLTNGDSLKLGDVGFEFQLSDEEMAALAAELPTTPERKPEAEAEPEAPDSADAPPVVRLPVRIGIFQVLVLLVLAAVAFWFGMATRHKNDFGIPLWVAILRGHPAPEKAKEKPPTPETGEVFAEQPDAQVPPPAPEGVPEEIEGWDQRDREAEENAEE
jgi:pSer/pThr/pTyr-binding forkhead associated (FHA) protein